MNAIVKSLLRTKEVGKRSADQSWNTLERAKSALSFLNPDCAREIWVRTAMATKAAGLSFEDFHQWSARGCSYKSRRDCEQVWKSIKQKGGVTERTLFRMAQEQGWQELACYSSGLSEKVALFYETEQRKDVLVPASENARTSNALHVWQAGIVAPESHPYIAKKQGMADSLRVYPESASRLIIYGKDMVGWLMVPCWNIDGVLQTIQFISPDGEKLNLPNTSFNDGLLVIGNFTQASHLFFVEGIGQAWAVCKTTGAAAVVCFGMGRMHKVAHVLRQYCPKAQLILVPDKGKEPDAAKIARAVNAEWCELPTDKKRNYDVNDLLLESGVSAVQSFLSSSKKPAMRFPLLSAAELKNAPPMEWLIQGVLPLRGLAAMYGPSGSGKSFLALDLAASMSAGKEEWFGHRIKQCPVTYACLEGVQGMATRIAAWCERHGATPDSLRFMTEPVNLLSSNDIAELAETIRAKNLHNGLVIVDTLNRASPNADENSSADMGRIIAGAFQLQGLVGGMVMLIHHSGKDRRQGMRGHSSLHAALDTIIEVAHAGHQHSWKVVKCKDGQDGGLFPFTLGPVLVGNNEQEFEVTSCTVIAGGCVTGNRQQSASTFKNPSGANQKIAKNTIDEMLATSGEVGQGGAPQGSHCIRYDNAVNAVTGSLTCGLKHRNERAREAINALIKQGIYCTKEEWIWHS